MKDKAARLLQLLADCKSAAVTFSGGVDSSLLALAAQKALGDKAVAITTASPAMSDGELTNARQVARDIGIQQEEIWLDETTLPEFAANDADRCYYCKKYRLENMCRWAGERGYTWVLDGSNLDDLSDWRPGLKALAEFCDVKSPLQKCGFTKQDIRALAKEWGLSVWDKPASPCLASRIEYGVPVTRERLRMVEEAEKIVAAYCPDKANMRVRCHKNLARIEIDPEHIPLLATPSVAGKLTAQLKALGFSFVSLDLAGFKSGGMNVGKDRVG